MLTPGGGTVKAVCSGTVVVYNVHPAPLTNLGPDTTLHWGDTLALIPQANQASYLWQNGSTQSSQLVGAPGTYAVTVTNSGGCQARDTVHVNFVPLCPAPISLGADTAVCNGTTLTFDAGPSFTSYAWSNGAATPTVNVTQPGLYSVIALDSNQCAGLDTVAYLAPPLLDLPALSACAGDSQLLAVPPHYLHTQWANGTANDSLWVTQPGSYPVFVVDSLACVQRDTAVVTLSLSANLIAPNTYKCPDKPALLQVAPTFSSYTWSSGGTGPGEWVGSPGLYTMSVIDSLGCAISDFTLLADYALVPIDLGPDTSHCQNDSIRLLPQQPYAYYAWSDGSSLGYLDVSSVGTYHVAAIDANGCETHDTIQVGIRPSPAAPLVSPPGPHTICATSSLQLSASPGYTSYTWSNGLHGNAISVTAAGDYFVAGFNQVGCSTRSALVHVAVDTVPTPSVIQIGNTLYSSDSAVAYQWMSSGSIIPGATGASFAPLGPGTYAVIVFDSLGCHAISPAVLVIVPVAVDEGMKMPQCSVSPNPSQGIVQLRFYNPGPASTVVLMLSDVAGRCIYHATIDLPAGESTQQLDLSSHPDGLYAMRIKAEAWSSTTRVVLRR